MLVMVKMITFFISQASCETRKEKDLGISYFIFIIKHNHSKMKGIDFLLFISSWIYIQIRFVHGFTARQHWERPGRFCPAPFPGPQAWSCHQFSEWWWQPRWQTWGTWFWTLRAPILLPFCCLLLCLDTSPGQPYTDQNKVYNLQSLLKFLFPKYCCNVSIHSKHCNYSSCKYFAC